MNIKWVWRVVLVVLILEVLFVGWFEMTIRYRESRFENQTQPFIWFTTDQF
jgi:hypothetical protein